MNSDNRLKSSDSLTPSAVHVVFFVEAHFPW